ncbi:MAG TPA: DHHA1 domain-containing protein [Vicinamibacterales bacterium]|nr:DHHA1 domain-containing protein [Vicinamibacterales bacterium]
MTERLYYADPYLGEFDASVVATLTHEGRPAVVLDRTAFYPTSGGQPFDTGALTPATDPSAPAVRVVDVVDEEDGRIVHVVDELPPPGRLHGTIDWARRFDHMQQHTGQHVLSAAFDRLFGIRTESFHLGAASATIDLARQVSPAELTAVEDEACRIVWEDRPVAIRFVDADEAARLSLRKPSARAGTLRLIDIADFDLSACGGTHVARTGAIGMIAIAASERFRGGSRVTFLCGRRALDGFRALRDAMAASLRVLSVSPAEMPSAIERVQADAKSLRRHVKDLQTELAGHEAAALIGSAETVGAVRLVTAVETGWDMNALKALAGRLAEQPDVVAVVVSEPAPASVAIACGAAAGVDCRALLSAAVSAFGGKGGGRPELAQGGGINAPAADVAETVREAARGTAGR